MSKSLARVTEALRAAGHSAVPLEMPGDTRTALQAATAAGCLLDQIVKSILFQGVSGRLYLFLTAGGNQVDAGLASALAGEALGRADAGAVRAVTGSGRLRARRGISLPVIRGICGTWLGRFWRISLKIRKRHLPFQCLDPMRAGGCKNL
jgi:Aminoacyl-tRNA editing domain